MGIHQPPVSSPHKDQWRGALMFYLICEQTIETPVIWDSIALFMMRWENHGTCVVLHYWEVTGGERSISQVRKHSILMYNIVSCLYESKSVHTNSPATKPPKVLQVYSVIPIAHILKMSMCRQIEFWWHEYYNVSTQTTTFSDVLCFKSQYHSFIHKNTYGIVCEMTAIFLGRSFKCMILM